MGWSKQRTYSQNKFQKQHDKKHTKKEIGIHFGHRKRGGGAKRKTQFQSMMDAALAQKAEQRTAEKDWDNHEVVTIAEQEAEEERSHETKHTLDCFTGAEQKQSNEATTGKKLSRRERRKREKMAVAAAKEAEASAKAAQASLEGAQFVCSQTPIEKCTTMEECIQHQCPFLQH